MQPCAILILEDDEDTEGMVWIVDALREVGYA